MRRPYVIPFPRIATLASGASTPVSIVVPTGLNFIAQALVGAGLNATPAESRNFTVAFSTGSGEAWQNNPVPADLILGNGRQPFPLMSEFRLTGGTQLKMDVVAGEALTLISVAIVGYTE